jgi:hypothetical protein
MMAVARLVSVRFLLWCAMFGGRAAVLLLQVQVHWLRLW